MGWLPPDLDGAPPRVRSALAWSTWDAVFFVVMDGLGSAALGLYALSLGVSTLALGLIVTVPLLAGSLAQFLSPALASALGGRKPAVLLGCLVQAASWASLPRVAALEGLREREAALLGIATLGTIGWFVSTPPWASWMGDLLPPALRTRYFAWRAPPVGAAQAAAILFMGWWLDRQPEDPASFRWLFLGAATARFLSVLCLCMQHEPPVGGGQDVGDAPAPAGFPRAVACLAGFHLALFVAAPYFVKYMKEIGYTNLQIVAVTAVSIPAKLLFLPAWARAASRYGTRRVLLASGMLTALVPWLWMLHPGWRWILVAQVANGVIWGGFELCHLPYLMEMTRPAERTRRMASCFSVSFLAGMVGSIAGDQALRHAPLGGVAGPYLWVFLLSGIGRVMAMGWGAWRFPEGTPGSARAGPRRILAEVLTFR